MYFSCNLFAKTTRKTIIYFPYAFLKNEIEKCKKKRYKEENL